MENNTPDLLPCPFCGNTTPFKYSSCWYAYIECDCGAGIKNSSVRVLYKMEDVPEGLKDKVNPANALIIRDKDGQEKGWTEHGYYGLNVMYAFEHAGILQKWNNRLVKS